MNAAARRMSPFRAGLAGYACILAACSSSNGGAAGAGGTGSQSGSSSSGGVSGSSSGSGSGSGSGNAGAGQSASGASSGGGSGDSDGGSGSESQSGSGDAAAGTATIGGTLGGQSLTPRSALAGSATGAGTLTNSGYPYETSILLANVAEACTLAASIDLSVVDTGDNVAVHNAQGLWLYLYTNAPLSARTIDVASPGSADGGALPQALADAFYGAWNATCAEVAVEESVSGTITIGTVTASEITGSFDLELGPINSSAGFATSGSDHVTGAFSAPICAAYSADLTNDNNGGGGAAADAGTVCQ